MDPKKTAVITGASSGIGFQLVHCFAKQGYHIIAIGRSQAKLDKLVQECHDQYSAKVTPLIVDLTAPEALSTIIKSLNELETIEVLVNNAGFGIWGPFTTTDLYLEQQMIQVQIHAMLALIKYVIPVMQRSQRGYILNVGSLFSFTPVPSQSIYAATKAFLLSFTQALRVELQNTNIVVSILCPGLTATEFRSRAGLSEETTWASMSAKRVAEAGYKGLMQDKAIIIPGWYNHLYVLFAKWLPMQLLAPFIGKFMGKFRTFQLPSNKE